MRLQRGARTSSRLGMINVEPDARELPATRRSISASRSWALRTAITSRNEPSRGGKARSCAAGHRIISVKGTRGDPTDRRHPPVGNVKRFDKAGICSAGHHDACDADGISSRRRSRMLIE
jgi:hypothetical protein